MDIRKFCKRLFRLVLRMTAFILSCAFSVIVAVLFLAFRILKGFVASYAEPLPDDNRPKPVEYKYSTDKKGNVIMDTNNGYPRM